MILSLFCVYILFMIKIINQSDDGLGHGYTSVVDDYGSMVIFTPHPVRQAEPLSPQGEGSRSRGAKVQL